MTGVTSFVHMLGFWSRAYHHFLHFFHSKAMGPDKLTADWARLP
jgi:hypothetical protein